MGLLELQSWYLVEYKLFFINVGQKLYSLGEFIYLLMWIGGELDLFLMRDFDWSIHVVASINFFKFVALEVEVF